MKMIGIELEDMPVPKWMAMSILVIGFAMLIVRFLQLGWKVVTGEADGFHFTDEAEESMEIAKELQELEQSQSGGASDNQDRDQNKNHDKEGRA